MFFKKNHVLFLVIMILMFILLLAFVKPLYFQTMFTTLLGNILLLGFILLISFFDVIGAVGMAVLLLIIYQAFHLCVCKHEGFEGQASGGVSSSRGLYPEGYPIPKGKNVWSSKEIDDFVKFQQIHNPNLRFDLDLLQQQATPEEVDVLLKTGKWPWAPDIQTMYKKAIAENNIINTEPGASLENAQTVYNQNAILQMLSWNTKEGSFLLNGAIIGHTADMPENINNVVKCGTDSSSGLSMQKIEYTGYDGIYGNMNSKVTPVDYHDLPGLVNGFSFPGGAACNPCVALSDPANYSCPFLLNTGNGAEVSDVWQHLWDVNVDGMRNTYT